MVTYPDMTAKISASRSRLSRQYFADLRSHETLRAGGVK